MKKQATETTKFAKEAGFTLVELAAAMVSRRLLDASQQVLLVQNIALKPEAYKSQISGLDASR